MKLLSQNKRASPLGFFLERRQEHDHLAALQLGFFFHRGDRAASFGEFVQQVQADLGVGHLAAAEAHRHLYFVAPGEELGGVFGF